jgi:hypothetical protein
VWHDGHTQKIERWEDIYANNNINFHSYVINIANNFEPKHVLWSTFPRCGVGLGYVLCPIKNMILSKTWTVHIFTKSRKAQNDKPYEIQLVVLNLTESLHAKNHGWHKLVLFLGCWLLDSFPRNNAKSMD